MKDVNSIYNQIHDGVYDDDQKKSKKKTWVEDEDIRENENGEVKTIVNKELAQQYVKKMTRNTYTP